MKDYFRFFDKLTFLLMFTLCVLGVFLIYSADASSPSHYCLKQILWFAISLVFFVIFFLMKTEPLFRHALWILLVITAILLFQFTAGMVIAKTRSWLRLGFFQIQVSEFVKIPLALALAKYMTTFDTVTLRKFTSLLAMIGIPIIFIALQPDFGVSFILCAYMIVILFLKRIRVSILILCALMAGLLLFMGWTQFLKPYQRDRIISFLNPTKYSQTTGYHVIQSKIAIGSGGLGGKGYLKGSQSRYKFLPTRHTDFIISVLGEEMGFLSIGCIFILYIFFFYRQLKFKFQTDEEFYFVYLFNGLIFFQFIINVAMAIGLFPVLGISLPFISYGGSSLLSLFIGEAIIFRIKINSYLT